MGAWIETDMLLWQLGVSPSHPTWVRGLKHISTPRYNKNRLSHPTWVRGLKLFGIAQREAERLSHPTWVRGLKHSIGAPEAQHTPVAPYVGAWIETLFEEPERVNPQSHPTWVRGLKPSLSAKIPSIAESHPTWVRGLKHLCSK